MVANSFAVMNLLFILWCPLSPNSSTGSLFDPRGSGRQEQFPAQRPLWISWTSRRRRRIVSIEMATSAWQAGLNYQPRCSPLLPTNLICIVTTHQHSSSDYFLDALASLGSMLESESVSESLTFLRFCQILGISSGYLQGMFRVCSECVQRVFRVCSECV